MSTLTATHPHSKIELDAVGIKTSRSVYWNLTPAELYEHALLNKEANLTADLALRVRTGQFTGRSPKDKFVVDQPSIHNDIDWGNVNQAVDEALFDRMYKKVQAYLGQKSLYVMDAYCGADEEYRLPIRVVSEAAYHALFSYNMFIRPTTKQLQSHKPEFTVLAAPNLYADPEEDGTRSSTFIFVNFDKKMILIGGTLYSGEVKKGIFGVMNYLLPKKGVMPMHCSANIDKDGNTSVFFGLSGTGKTTLSADLDKTLIGDDEHGWSDNGIFNFEGGCYAKTINLSEENEPIIYATTKRWGTILENVPLDEYRRPRFKDKMFTENTRCAYPLSFVPNAKEDGKGGHPKNIIFLTADAFGVLPPISRLTPEQAMYHFISGYTAKVAGTERGVTEPQATFSACFGSPFMPLHPSVYAELLADKIRKHDAKVWLVNTGWTGGPYGVGKRMKLPHTRRMLTAAIAGELDNATFTTDPTFGLEIPTTCPDVPADILIPKNTWNDPAAYDEKAKLLASMFAKNFEQFASKCSEEVTKAGPKI